MIIIGLGNPGLKYKGTYHNAGYGVADAVAELLGKKINRAECNSLTAVTEYKGSKLVIAKPLTYMNNSGEAVASLVAKYGGEAGEAFVCYDDIDLDRFAVRIRAKGSGGTHNGMRDVVRVMRTEDIKRLRVGIGRPDYDLKDYVLDKPSKADGKRFAEVFAECARLLLGYAADGDFDKLMREGNSLNNG